MAKKSTTVPKLPSKQYGYVNRKGEWIIEPQFDYACPFHDGIAKVQKENLWGFIDETGNWVVTPQFDFAFNAVDGMARVTLKGKDGFINKSGIVIKPKFAQAMDFIGDFAIASDSKGKFGIIDKKGEWVLKPKFEEAKYCSYSKYDKTNEVIIGVKEKGLWGYINQHGDWILEPCCDEIQCFHDGLAFVKKDGHFGCIGQSGNWLAKPIFDNVRILWNGKAEIEKDGRYGEINSSGEWLSYEEGGDPSNDNYLIVQRDGLWGLMDRSGNWIVEPLYDSLTEKPIGGTDEKYYLAKKDGLWGLINESGTVVTEPRFTKIESFNKEKIAPVRWDGHWGIINTEGRLISQFKLAPRTRVGALDPSVPQTDDFMDKMLDVFSFHDGYALVQFQYRCDRSGFPKFDYGYIDSEGNLLCEPIFDKAWSFDDSLAVVQVKNKYGIINQEGQYILKPQFNDIELPTGNSQKNLIPVMTK